MENYIKNFNTFNQAYIYDFQLGNGGIGDCIKFFMYILKFCIKNNIRLYYKINNIALEKYIKLKYENMYIFESKILLNISFKLDIMDILKEEKTVYRLADGSIINFIDTDSFVDIKTVNNNSGINYFYVVKPHYLYNLYNADFQNSDNLSVKIEDVFYFTKEITNHPVIRTIPENYISIHLRLGDKHLETDPAFIQILYDERDFNENNIYKYIEENNDKNIFFCCDNNSYKLKLKEKYNNVYITNLNIGHSGLFNTTPDQVLSSVIELYILTMSQSIYSGSNSGFSLVASQFQNIPLIH